jgi:hypothetical protein
MIGESRAHVAVVSGAPKKNKSWNVSAEVMRPFCGLGMQNSVQMISVHLCVLLPNFGMAGQMGDPHFWSNRLVLIS